MRKVALTTFYTTLAEINMPEDWYLVSDRRGSVSIRTPVGDIRVHVQITLEPERGLHFETEKSILNQVKVESRVLIDHNDRRGPE